MKADIIIDRQFTIGKIDDRVYGSFIEHLGRAVYGGIYEPGHPEADELGFRKDVLELVKDLKVPIVRYPGGNFVSAFNWEDSVGPVSDRPKRLDLAWKTTEPNLVGLYEFTQWAEKAETEVMMAINLGTRGLEEARNLVEYCNFSGDSYWADLRRSHGRKEPYGYKVWCLGNEMDGPWQTGHKTATEYGRIASETARSLRQLQPDLELVACGSSTKNMPTFPDWEREVLEHCYNDVDYLSLHSYYRNPDDDMETFLASAVDMDDFIETVTATCDYVQGRKRSRKKMMLSFDEYNVWYHSGEQDKKTRPWQIAPPLLEDIYNFEDALVVGTLINSLIRHADRVKMACMAQLVNVIAPIMTETGGPAWKQTIYWPYYYASIYGRGISLGIQNNTECYSNKSYGDVPYLDIAGVWNPEEKQIALFMVNRSPSEKLDLNLRMGSFDKLRLLEHKKMDGFDMKLANSKEKPDAVTPSDSTSCRVDGEFLKGHITPLSWNMILLSTESKE